MSHLITIYKVIFISIRSDIIMITEINVILFCLILILFSI